MEIINFETFKEKIYYFTESQNWTLKTTRAAITSGFMPKDSFEKAIAELFEIHK